jgi:hypothetical protein
MMAKYYVYYMNKNEKGKVYEIKIKLSDECTVNECIALAIKGFIADNRQLNLEQNIENYELFYAKKNGEKKDDYPCL